MWRNSYPVAVEEHGLLSPQGFDLTLYQSTLILHIKKVLMEATRKKHKKDQLQLWVGKSPQLVEPRGAVIRVGDHLFVKEQTADGTWSDRWCSEETSGKWRMVGWLHRRGCGRECGIVGECRRSDTHVRGEGVGGGLDVISGTTLYSSSLPLIGVPPRWE